MSFACIFSLDLFVPDSSIPDEIPNFVGRDKACKYIEDHLTDSVTRLVNVWGPPGFGKTSAAIRVAHRLQKKNIPVYFASLRGMESKEDLVSKLLSMFVDDKQVDHISSSHFSIQCLQQVQNPFVLILDNADDLLESGDTKRKEHVLSFIEEILNHCKQIKLLLTTHESLDYLSHKLPIYLAKINVLDGISSANLVRQLLPDASECDCNCIVKECENVPMSMRLMCSIIKQENISVKALLQELSVSTLVEVLDSEYFPEEARLKSVINTSFKTLMTRERDAFVSLSVLPEWFGIEEAQAILNRKSEFQTKQIIRSLERKSLIECTDKFSHFTIHSLFRSFIEEETKNDQAVGNVFFNAQLQFYDYYISSCKVANENFLKDRFGDAFRSFLHRRSCIISSLSNGPRKDRIYPKAVELLSEAKSFLRVALHGDQLFENLYDTAIVEAKRRGKLGDEQMLHSAKEFPPGLMLRRDTVKSFFWLSRVQREAGDLKGAIESVKVGKELLENSEQGDDVMRDSKSAYEAFQKVQDVNANLIPNYVFTTPHYYNVRCSIPMNHQGALKSLQRAAGMRSNPLRDDEETARIYHELSRVQRQVGDLKAALESVQVGLRLRKKLLGDHPDTADSYHEKGVISYVMCDSNSAVEAFQKAAVMNLNLRRDHINTANSYYNLGIAQFKIQDREGALQSLQSAADMRSHLLGDHEDTALSYIVLGKVQREVGDLKGAMESVQMCLRMSKNHANTAFGFNEQGVIYHVMGECKSAVEAFQKAVDLNTNLLGEHINTAHSYHNLGMAQSKMKDHQKALTSLQRAAHMRSNLLGDHEVTAYSYHSLGLVQCDMGDLKGALDSLQRAANMRLSVLGDHKDTASSFFKLGVVQKKAKDLKSALKSVQVSLRLRKELLGDYPKTADSLHEQGILLCIMGDSKSAVEALQKAADINFNFRGDHRNTARNYHSLGIAQELMGDQEGALDSLQKAAHMQSNLLGDHEDTASSYLVLGLVQRDMGDLKGALDSLQRAAHMQSNLLGDNEDTACSFHKLGLVQRDMGDLKGALDSLQKAANMRSNSLGDHEDTASSYHELGVIQHGMGDLKKALRSLKEALDMRTNLLGDHGDTTSSLNELRAVRKKLSSGRSVFGKVFRQKNRHENNDKL